MGNFTNHALAQAGDPYAANTAKHAQKKWLCRLGPWNKVFEPMADGAFEELCEWAQEKSQHYVCWNELTKNTLAQYLKRQMWEKEYSPLVEREVFGRDMRFDPLPLPKRIKKSLLCEVVADLAYMAGAAGLYSGDSRADMREIIRLAERFEADHSETDWDAPGNDYIQATEDYFADFAKSWPSENPIVHL